MFHGLRDDLLWLLAMGSYLKIEVFVSRTQSIAELKLVHLGTILLHACVNVAEGYSGCAEEIGRPVDVEGRHLRGINHKRNWQKPVNILVLIVTLNYVKMLSYFIFQNVQFIDSPRWYNHSPL